MGKGASKLPTEKMKEYLRESSFTENELRLWYKYFIRECPNGTMNSEQFLNIYKLFHPSGRPEQFASHVFRVFDRNKDGSVDFDDFLGSIHITAKGTFSFFYLLLEGWGLVSDYEILLGSFCAFCPTFRGKRAKKLRDLYCWHYWQLLVSVLNELKFVTLTFKFLAKMFFRTCHFELNVNRQIIRILSECY